MGSDCKSSTKPSPQSRPHCLHKIHRGPTYKVTDREGRVSHWGTEREIEAVTKDRGLGVVCESKKSGKLGSVRKKGVWKRDTGWWTWERRQQDKPQEVSSFLMFSKKKKKAQRDPRNLSSHIGVFCFFLLLPFTQDESSPANSNPTWLHSVVWQVEGRGGPHAVLIVFQETASLNM